MEHTGDIQLCELSHTDFIESKEEFVSWDGPNVVLPVVHGYDIGELHPIEDLHHRPFIVLQLPCQTLQDSLRHFKDLLLTYLFHKLFGEASHLLLLFFDLGLLSLTLLFLILG